MHLVLDNFVLVLDIVLDKSFENLDDFLVLTKRTKA